MPASSVVVRVMRPTEWDIGFIAPSTHIPHSAFMVYPLPAVDPELSGALVCADAPWRTDAVGLRE